MIKVCHINYPSLFNSLKTTIMKLKVISIDSFFYIIDENSDIQAGDYAYDPFNRKGLIYHMPCKPKGIGYEKIVYTSDPLIYIPQISKHSIHLLNTYLNEYGTLPNYVEIEHSTIEGCEDVYEIKNLSN
jgi:hypothetical protein